MEHPAYRISHLGSDWDPMTNRLMKASCQHRVDTREPDTPCLREEAERVMRRHWPNLDRRWTKGEAIFEGPGILELSGHAMDEFPGRSQPTC
jgi:hypothetical protein